MRLGLDQSEQGVLGEQSDANAGDIEQSYQLVLLKQPNIELYPSEEDIKQVNESVIKNDITIGDLHGNFVKLLYVLVRFNLIKISLEDYQRLVQIYKQDAWSKEDINQFQGILDAIKRNESIPVRLIRLIGDELSDRGSNDYFTLYLFKCMHKLGLPFEIIFSNHSAEFLYFHWYGKSQWDDDPRYEEAYVPSHRSQLELYKLVTAEIISLEDIKELVDKYYLSHLAMLSYSIEPRTKHVTVYTHAPVGLKTIEGIAESFHVQPDLSNLLAFCRTIDKINLEFVRHRITAVDLIAKRQDLVGTNPVLNLVWIRGQNYYKEFLLLDGTKEYRASLLAENAEFTIEEQQQKWINYFENYLWKIFHSASDESVRINYQLTFVHGHCGEERSSLNGITINLDSPCGQPLTIEQQKKLLDSEPEFFNFPLIVSSEQSGPLEHIFQSRQDDVSLRELAKEDISHMQNEKTSHVNEQNEKTSHVNEFLDKENKADENLLQLHGLFKNFQHLPVFKKEDASSVWTNVQLAHQCQQIMAQYIMRGVGKYYSALRVIGVAMLSILKKKISQNDYTSILNTTSAIIRGQVGIIEEYGQLTQRFEDPLQISMEGLLMLTDATDASSGEEAQRINAASRC
ncbi:MAG: hypothetical protein GKR77_06320 [Legionellales bacterium]|nr:hypothetical protein [Legionellales bacterium]